MKLSVNFELDIIPNKQLKKSPKYILPSGIVYGGENISDTPWYMGSNNVSSNISNTFDTLSFDEDTRLLCGIGFYTHMGLNDLETQLSSWWLNTPIITGLPRLITRAMFPIKLGNSFWCSNDGSSLAVFYPLALYQSSNAMRLQIMKDTYLLMVNQQLAGWLLMNPAEYLVEHENQTPLRVQTPNTNYMLGELFNLTSGENLDMMIDGDYSVYEKLRDLKQRLENEANDFEKCILMIKYIDEFLLNYYEL